MIITIHRDRTDRLNNLTGKTKDRPTNQPKRYPTTKPNIALTPQDKNRTKNVKILRKFAFSVKRQTRDYSGQTTLKAGQGKDKKDKA